MGRGGIRRRVTVLATVVVAVVLALAGASLVLAQRAILTDSIDQTLIQRANDIVALMEADQPLDELPPTATEAFAQIVDDDGAVVVSTPNLTGSPPLPFEIGPRVMARFQVVEGLEVDDDSFRVLSRRIEGVGVLHIGTTFDVVSESATALMSSLAVGIPVVAITLAALVWWLVGRTLEPVEAIRAEVAAIDSTELDRRVPAPGTGDEIDRLAGTMNAMLERVERAVTHQQRFVSDASHELRNPLTRIRTTLEVELAAAGPAAPQLMKDVLHEVVGLQHMVEDMLYLARADEGKLRRKFRRVDLDDLVLREVRNLRSRADIQMDLKRVSAAQVHGDPAQLSRAIRNLVANAERHAIGRVELRLAESGDEAVLAVSDDGPGIPPEQAEFIFERFTRLDDSRNLASGGTGLGLAIAREIVETHAGTLRVIDDGMPGATFEMRIPLAK